MAGMSRVKKNGIVKIIVFIVINTTVAFALYNFLDFKKISGMSDFHVNMITASLFIGGFLFTGLGVLLGAIGNHRIQRLFTHNYFNVFYATTVMGVVSDIASIIVSLMFMCTNISDSNPNLFYTIEIATFLCSLFAFLIAIINICFIIDTLKMPDPDQ